LGFCRASRWGRSRRVSSAQHRLRARTVRLRGIQPDGLAAGLRGGGGDRAPAANARARAAHFGTEDEPAGFFWARNGLIAAAIIFIAYLLATYRGLPNVLITMAALAAVYAFLTSRTTIGRRVYALGGNEKAAKLSGINTERLTFLTFVNMGMLAALAGLIFAARLNTATPKSGVAFELDVIAAVFIGGASMSGAWARSRAR
jgi:putative multiple sugar transport system permease protein